MKKFYLCLATMLMATFATVTAQSGTERSVPRPQAPGVEFNISGNVAPTAKFKRPLKKTKLETAARIVAQQIENDVAGYTPYDTILLSKYSYKVDGNEEFNSTYTYDEYGHRKLVKTASDSRTYESRYTYTIGQFNFWTSKLIEMKPYYSDEWSFESKEEREIDSFKRLTVRKTYGITEGTGEPYLEREEHFDYAHQYYDDMADLKYGYRVKDIYYNSDGSIYSSEEYAWYQPAEQYILKSRSSQYSKRESTFGSDFVTYRVYSDYEGTGYVLESEEEHYFGNKRGELVKQYNNGELSYCYGSYYEIQDNTPEANYKTYTFYEYGEYDRKWVPVNRTIATGMKYEDGGFQEQFKVNYSIRSENYYDGEWQIENQEKGEWLSNNILRRTSTYDGVNESVNHTLYDADGDPMGSVTYNDDNSYVLTSAVEIDGNYVAQYTYYGADGKVQKTIVQKKTLIGANQSEECIGYYLKEGDKLTPLTDYEIITSYGGQRARASYKFTEKGWPLSTTIEVSMAPDQPFMKYSKTAYEYNDKGYKVYEYDYAYMNSNNGTPIELLGSMTEYKLLDNGTYQCTDYEYDEDDGSISYASRTENTKDFIKITYSYNRESKTFEVSDKYCLPIETVAADGTLTRIERYIDENGNPVNSSKSEELRKGNERMEAYYSWNPLSNKWEGSYKNYSREEVVEFNYRYPVDPCTMYDDEYLVFNEDAISHNTEYYSYADYEWDYETDDWYISRCTMLDFDINGNTLKLTRTEIEREMKRTTKFLIVGNSNGFIEKEEMSVSEENGETNEKEEHGSVTTNIFNSYNLLTESCMVETDIDGTTTTKANIYEYTACKVYPTDIKQIVADGMALTVSGLSISSSADSYIELYTVTGAKVAAAYGTITAPAEGTYIVKCNGTAATVMVR